MIENLLPAVTVLALLALPPAPGPEPPGFGIPNATRPEEGLLIAANPPPNIQAAAKAGYIP